MNRRITTWRDWLASRLLTGAALLLALASGNAQSPRAVLLPPTSSAEPGAQPVPISLDTVLRLAQDQNGQMAIARQHLQEAFARQDLAAKKWLPELTIGTAYYRHEGGIQDFDGQFIHSSYGSLFAGLEMRGKLDLRETAYQRIDAERKVWQQKGELSKLTSETLLDAAGTYVDILAAGTSAVVSLESEKRLADLAVLAQTLAKVDPGLRIELVRVNSEIQGQKIMTRKLHEGAGYGSAKLTYLLGIDPKSDFIIVDRRLVAFELVDHNQPTQVLVNQAVVRGPGVRELEGLLNLIEDARAKSNGPGRFMPSFEVVMAEGAFGAGPGAQSTWDNRWDLGLHVTWNLTEALTAREKRRLADAQTQQARLSYRDLRAKLALGVHEAREACLSAQEQMHFGELQIKAAEESYELSNTRFQENIKGRSSSEVLQAIRGLAGARLSYLQAVRDFDKAQLRLFVLVGGYNQITP